MSGRRRKRTPRRRPPGAAPASLSPSTRARPAVRAREAGTRELVALRKELERTAGALGGRAAAPRWNPDPEDVQRSVARLVLSLVELVRKLLERQAIRRMDEGTLSDEEIERIGVSLMKLEKTIHAMAKRFGLRPEELNLDLGPLGRLH